MKCRWYISETTKENSQTAIRILNLRKRDRLWLTSICKIWWWLCATVAGLQYSRVQTWLLSWLD